MSLVGAGVPIWELGSSVRRGGLVVFKKDADRYAEKARKCFQLSRIDAAVSRLDPGDVLLRDPELLGNLGLAHLGLLAQLSQQHAHSPVAFGEPTRHSGHGGGIPG